jgi:hypothetical protein
MNEIDEFFGFMVLAFLVLSFLVYAMIGLMK